MKNKTKLIFTILIFLTLAVWANISRLSADQPTKGVQVSFLDVSQGDAILISKGETQILVDGGPDEKVLTELGKVMPPSDRKIEEVILTHPHSDHLRGLVSILDRYEIGKIYYTDVNYDSNGYLEFTEKAKTKSIPMIVPDVGYSEETIQGSSLTFLWPGKKYENSKINNLNNSSEAIRFCYLSYCLLSAGDLEADEQKEMFNYYNCNPGQSEVSSDIQCNIQSDLLKISHHGSTNGSDQAALDLIKPQKAVISVGADNKYGHPHADILNLLQENNIQVWRTDQSGTVEFLFTEQGIVKK